MERTTKTFTTSSGAHSIVYKEYMTAYERRELMEIYLNAADETKSGVTQKGELRPNYLAEKKTLELMIDQLDGLNVDIVNRLLALPVADYDEIQEVIKNVMEPKKKEQTT